MSLPAPVALLREGHEEKFEDFEATVEVLKKDGDGPQRFRAVAYTGVDVSRAFGRMVISTKGMGHGERMGMLLEHDDHMPVAVCDHFEVDNKHRLVLEGYFLDDVASHGHSAAVMARMKQGWPMKMSVGVRFKKHSFLEEGSESEVNGRTFKGPMVLVEESHLFETSFIHVNPADLDTEAAMMRAQAREQSMADALKPEIDEAEKEKLRAEGENRVRQRLAEEGERSKALRLAFPGKSAKAEERRKGAEKMSTSELKDVAASRLQRKVAKLQEKEREREEALKGIRERSPHAGAAFDPATAAVVQDRGEQGFSGSIDDRVYAELRQRPKLMEVFRGAQGPDARRVISAWLKARDRVSTRNGAPVLCDLMGGGGHVSPATLASLKKMVDDVLVGFEAQRLDVGSSAPDLARTTINGFQGMFYTSYEEELSKNWSLDLSFQIPSDQQIEIVRWLGPPPMIQEWKGPRIAKGLPIYEQLLKAVKFEGTLDISRWDWDHQKWDLIAKSFGLFGAVASQHWDIRFTQLLENNPTAYDSFAFFSASHTLGGDSGTIINDYTSTGTGGAAGVASKLNVADPTQPTQLEWANIILQLYPKFMDWAWANGIKMNGTAQKFGVMVHPSLVGNLNGALQSERLDFGASNPLFGQRQMFVAIPNAYITKKQYGYMFRLDTQNKPLLRAEPDPLEMMWMGPGSHMAYTEDKYSMGLRAVRSIAPGAFESALRFTIGAA